jgi:hypothetical protein
MLSVVVLFVFLLNVMALVPLQKASAPSLRLTIYQCGKQQGSYSQQFIFIVTYEWSQ